MKSGVPYKVQLEEKQSFLKDIEKTLHHYDFPPQIIIESTAACNLTCIHCSHSTMTRTKGNMKEWLWRKLIDEIAEKDKGTEVWPTFYGEALILRQRITDWMRYAVKEKGLTNVVLNSNGQLLTDEMIDAILECGLHRFIISMDGFTKETFERIRQGATHERVYGQAQKLLKRKKELGADHIEITMQYSMMDDNDHEVEDFKKFWLEKGAIVKTREKLTWTGTKDAPNLDQQIERIACPWALRACAIHWNGDLVTCAVDYDGRYVAGNVSERTIEDVWNHEHKELNAKHLQHRFDELPDICKPCLDWQVAGGAHHEQPESHVTT